MRLGSILVTFSAVSLALGAARRMTPRQVPSDTVTCGSNRYDSSAIEAAIGAGVTDMISGYYPDNYPHRYYDEPSEGIALSCSSSGPWYEFPLMPDGSIYDSTPEHYVSLGTDRVVFMDDGSYCAVVTHTGAATRNGFVACVGD